MRIWGILFISVIFIACQQKKRYNLSLCNGEVSIEMLDSMSFRQIPRTVFGNDVFCVNRFQSIDSSINIDIKVMKTKSEISDEFLSYEIDRLKFKQSVIQILRKEITREQNINTITILYKAPFEPGLGGYIGLCKVLNTSQGRAEIDIIYAFKSAEEESKSLQFIENVSKGIHIKQ